MLATQKFVKDQSSSRTVSASQFLAMLNDNIIEKQVYALRKLA